MRNSFILLAFTILALTNTCYAETKLSEEQVAEHKKDFDSFDLDKNGILDREEVKKAALEDQEVTESEIDEFISEIDTNQDKLISWEEYLVAAEGVSGAYDAEDDDEDYEGLDDEENDDVEELDDEQGKQTDM